MIARVLAFLLLLPTGFTALAGEPFFCTQPGRTLYYERSDAAGGRLRRTTTIRITEVTDTPSGRRVGYEFTLRRPGGGVMYGGPAAMSVDISPDGTTGMDLGATLKAVLRGYLPKAEPVSTGTRALVPADMRPGDMLPDAGCVVKALGISYRIEVTERRVVRAERVTVPAGTFDCLVVHEHKVEDGPGHHRDTYSESWYAAGIGYVRHDTYDKKHRLETTEVLKNY